MYQRYLVTVNEARDNLGNIINQVNFAKTPFTITRYGKEAAVVVPVEQWNKAQKILQQLEDEEDIRDAEEALESIKKHGGITHDELLESLGLKRKCTKSSMPLKSKKQSKPSQKKIKKASPKRSKS